MKQHTSEMIFTASTDGFVCRCLLIENLGKDENAPDVVLRNESQHYMHLCVLQGEVDALMPSLLV